MAYFGTKENPCKWEYNSNEDAYYITIPTYNFHKAFEDSNIYGNVNDHSMLKAIEDNIISEHTIKLYNKDYCKLSPLNKPSFLVHAPTVLDVRHAGSQPEPYKECDFYGKNIPGGLSGAKLFASEYKFENIHTLLPTNSESSWYNTKFNESDSDQNVWTVNTITDINPNGEDQKKTLKLLNYDSSSTNLHIKWNTHSIVNPAWDPNSTFPIRGAETVFDMFAVRARFSINYDPDNSDNSIYEGNNKGTAYWSHWFYNFASSNDDWDSCPLSMTLYGSPPPNASDSNNWWGFGSKKIMDYHYNNDIVYQNGNKIYNDPPTNWKSNGYTRYRTRIPPYYPYSFYVQVEVANLCGINTGLSQPCNGINQHQRWVKGTLEDGREAPVLENKPNSTTPKTYYYRYNARKICVKQAVTNASLLNVKPYTDWLCVNFCGPAGTKTNLNPNENPPDVDESDYTWFGGDTDDVSLVSKIIVYAKEKNLDYKLVFRWKASPIEGKKKNNMNAEGYGLDEDGKININTLDKDHSIVDTNPRDKYHFIRTSKLCLAKQNEIIPNVNDSIDGNGNVISKMDKYNTLADNAVNSQIFKPDTVYTLKIYYTIVLNDTDNAWYRKHCDTNGNTYNKIGPYNEDTPNKNGKISTANKYGYGWKETRKTITRSKTFKVRTLSLAKLFFNYTNTAGELINYKYIFGRSELVNPANGKPYPMTFRVERPVGFIQDVNINTGGTIEVIPNNAIKNTTKTFTNNYDQFQTLRFTLSSTKANNTVNIVRTLNPDISDDINSQNRNDGTLYQPTYSLDFKARSIDIYISLDEWDGLYRLMEKNNAPYPDLLPCNVQLETRSSYQKKNSNGELLYIDPDTDRETTSHPNSTYKPAYKWYKNDPSTAPLTITLTGIHPTSHVNNKLSEIKDIKSPHRRAYAWVNASNKTTNNPKRAVVWINPTNIEREVQQRCI